MSEPIAIAAWKRNKVTAGAMMLLRGYVEPVTLCDRCGRSLERADGVIDVRFEKLTAIFDCPHCGGRSTRPLEKPAHERA